MFKFSFLLLLPQEIQLLLFLLIKGIVVRLKLIVEKFHCLKVICFDVLVVSIQN